MSHTVLRHQTGFASLANHPENKKCPQVLCPLQKVEEHSCKANHPGNSRSNQANLSGATREKHKTNAHSRTTLTTPTSFPLKSSRSAIAVKALQATARTWSASVGMRTIKDAARSNTPYTKKHWKKPERDSRAHQPSTTEQKICAIYRLQFTRSDMSFHAQRTVLMAACPTFTSD